MMSATDERDLVTALHGGGDETPLWSTFLVRLRRRFRADAARLVLTRGGDKARPRIEIVAEPEASQARLVEHRTPHWPPGTDVRSQRVYTLSELSGGVNAVAPCRHGLLLKISEPPLTAWLILARANEEFTAGERALLSGLTQHLSIALRNHVGRELAQAREAVLADLLGPLELGWLTLTAEGALVDADARAGALMRSGVLLTAGPDGGLATRSPAANQRLAQAIERLAVNGSAKAEAIRITDHPRLDLLLKRLPGPDDGAGGALLIAYLQGDRVSSHGSAEILGMLFGLAPREARLATVLAEGRGIGEAAVRLGLTVETARNYSKTLYAKLGARGQAELATIVSTSLARLA